MKKSSLYFIYVLLFAILASVAENIAVKAISAAGVLTFAFGAIVIYYFDNKPN